MNRSLRNLPVWLGCAGVLAVALLTYGPIHAQPQSSNAVPPPTDAQQVLDPVAGAAITVDGYRPADDSRPVPGQPVPAFQPARPVAVTVQGRPFEEVRGRGDQRGPHDPLVRFVEGANQPIPAMARIQDQIRRATEGLRNAESDEQKTQAMQALKDTLNEYFDADLQRRADELAQIEVRVKNLREQLALRRDKKQEIIDLQIKVAQNEADGLGFFGMPGGPDSRPTAVNVYGTAGGAVYRDPPGDVRTRTTRPAQPPQDARPRERGPNPQGGGGEPRLEVIPFGPGQPNPANPPLPGGPPR